MVSGDAFTDYHNRTARRGPCPVKGRKMYKLIGIILAAYIAAQVFAGALLASAFIGALVARLPQ